MRADNRALANLGIFGARRFCHQRRAFFQLALLDAHAEHNRIARVEDVLRQDAQPTRKYSEMLVLAAPFKPQILAASGADCKRRSLRTRLPMLEEA